MTWVDLSAVFAYGTKLTSTQMQNLRDNIAAFAAGDSGAPLLQEGAIDAGVVTVNKIGALAVSQGKLKTATGSVSVVVTGGDSETAALPGGGYGFRVRVYATSNSINFYGFSYYSLPGSYTSPKAVFGSDSPSGHTGYAQETYVQSSGEVHWIFSLRNRETGLIESSWQSPDHPCFGNGDDPAEFMHPFGLYDEDKYEMIVINPSKSFVKEIQFKAGKRKDFLEVLSDQYIIDDLSSSAWPTEEVTVGLNGIWEDEPLKIIKAVIPKPKQAITRVLKLKN